MPEAAMSEVALQLHPSDDVVVAVRAIAAGTVLTTEGARVTVAADIAPGHKIALNDILRDNPVRKYGQTIGFATRHIAAGDHVHTHNLAIREFDRDYAIGSDCRPVEPATPDERRTFMGYARPDGRVGTRNYVAVISSVNCSASTSRYVVDRFRGVSSEYPNVDGVVAFTHKSGCCVQPGEPARQLERVLAGFARHPNVGAYVLIGLGCETNHISVLVENEHLLELQAGEARPPIIHIQESGGIAKTIEAGVHAVRQLLPVVDGARRTPQPVGKLCLAMNCGGSDGNSGITANPALGVASDLLVRQGAASVLAETTEIYGAEHLLTRRAASREVGEALVERVRWWENHTKLFGATIDNNPTFGNKQGGLTTIYEKSLGAVAKAGQSPLMAVYRYAQRIDTPGLGFMDTPGLDPVSMTGLVAGGCNICCFTTGRGSVYGCKPSPSIKIATNTALYEHMIDDMDINAGTIIDGAETIEQVGDRIYEKIVAVASGQRTKSEQQGVGDEEFAPWIMGPTL